MQSLGRVASMVVLCAVACCANAASDDTLEETVVTARRRSEPLQEVPLAVSVLSGATIAACDWRSPVDLSASVPSLLTPRNAVLADAPTFFIRGVGEGDHNWNTENGVAIFVDDVYLQSTAGAWVDMLDLDRVEVLRGPQGTLYGRNSTSGAIRFVPRRPDMERTSAYAEAVAGGRSRLDARAGLNAPLAGGKAALKLDVFRTTDDGHFTRVDTLGRPIDPSLDRTEHYGARIATLWRASDTLEFELNGDIVRHDDGINLVTPIVPADPAARSTLAQLLSKRGTVRFVPLYGIDRGALEPLTVGGGTGHTGGGLVFKAKYDSRLGTLRSITAWRSYDEHFTSQLGGRGTPSTIFGVTLWGNVDTQFERVHQLTQEFQLTGSAGTRLDYTVGAFWFDSRWTESEYGATNGVPANFSPFTLPGQTQPYGGSWNDIDQSTHSYALYANADWHATDRVTISVGARQTWDSKKLRFDTLFEDHVHSYPGFPLRTNRSWNRFTPRAGVDWRIADDVLAYASYAKGYKVGNVEGARSSNAANASNWLAPELATTWEAGLKTEWLQRRLRVNVAAFTSLNTGRTDLISPDLAASSDIRSKGLEAEVAWSPAASVRLFANAGLLWAHYRNLSPNHPALAPDPSGFAPGYAARPPMTPRYTISAGADRVFTFAGGRTITVSATGVGVARHYHALGIANLDSEIIAPYTVLDGSLTLRGVDGRAELAVGAHNLLDRRYYASGLFGSIPEFAGRYYADGRRAYVRLRYAL